MRSLVASCQPSGHAERRTSKLIIMWAHSRMWFSKLPLPLNTSRSLSTFKVIIYLSHGRLWLPTTFTVLRSPNLPPLLPPHTNFAFTITSHLPKLFVIDESRKLLFHFLNTERVVRMRLLRREHHVIRLKASNVLVHFLHSSGLFGAPPALARHLGHEHYDWKIKSRGASSLFI